MDFNLDKKIFYRCKGEYYIFKVQAADLFINQNLNDYSIARFYIYYDDFEEYLLHNKMFHDFFLEIQVYNYIFVYDESIGDSFNV